MKIATFLLVTAVVEIVVGLVLLIVPSGPVSLLLGIDEPVAAALLLARWIGAALLAIGVASGMARHDRAGPARRGVLFAVLLYDIAAALLFIYGAIGLQLAGPVLWPAALLHTVLAIWGLLCLRADATA
jgi:hypothetical protein